MANYHKEAGTLGYQRAEGKLMEYREEQRRWAHARFEALDPKCGFCSKPIPYEHRRNKFCNQSCAASCNNSRLYGAGLGPLPLCLACGNRLSRHGRTYCNSQCMQDHRWEERKREIVEAGVLPYTTDMRVAKRFLLEEHGRVCSICSITEWTGKPVPLELDHVNGNSGDNRVENLRMICGNCGMLLPTYKGRNKGKGRHSRRERYREGKSY